MSVEMLFLSRLCNELKKRLGSCYRCQVICDELEVEKRAKIMQPHTICVRFFDDSCNRLMIYLGGYYRTLDLRGPKSDPVKFVLRCLKIWCLL